MSVLFDGDSSNDGLRSSLIDGISAFPISISAWGRPATNSTWITVASMADTNQTNRWIALNMIASNFEVQTVGTGTTGHSGGGTYSTGVWIQLGARWFGTAGSHTEDLIKDGVDVAGGSNTRNPFGAGDIDRLGVGLLADLTASREYDGYIADVGFWTAQLTDQQFLLMANGVSPRLIEFASLIAYYPMMGGTLDLCKIDHSGNQARLNQTLSTPTVATLNPPLPMDFGWSNRGLHHVNDIVVDTGQTATVTAVAFAMAVPAVAIELGAVTAAVAAVSFTLAVPAVAIELGAVTADVASVAFALVVPAVTVELGGAVTNVAAVAFALAVPAVTIEFGGVTAAVAAVEFNLGVPVVVITTGVTAVVSAVSFTLAVPAVTTAVGAVTADVTAVAFVMAVPDVVIVLGGVTTAPAVVSFTLEVPAVTTTQGSIADVVAVSFGLEVPSVAVVLGGITAAVAAVEFALVVPGVVVTQPGTGALFPNVLDGSTGRHYQKPKGLQRQTS